MLDVSSGLFKILKNQANEMLEPSALCMKREKDGHTVTITGTEALIMQAQGKPGMLSGKRIIGSVGTSHFNKVNRMLGGAVSTCDGHAFIDMECVGGGNVKIAVVDCMSAILFRTLLDRGVSDRKVFITVPARFSMVRGRAGAAEGCVGVALELLQGCAARRVSYHPKQTRGKCPNKCIYICISPLRSPLTSVSPFFLNCRS